MKFVVLEIRCHEVFTSSLVDILINKLCKFGFKKNIYTLLLFFSILKVPVVSCRNAIQKFQL